MSSAPAGVDVREYAYGYYGQGIGAGTLVISAQNRWLVTKIQMWAGPDNAINFVLAGGGGGSGGPPDFVIQPSGCMTLEPNGAFRGDVHISGQGGQFFIEFWWQPTGNVSYPVITVT
jgi:hypothetical protein